MNVQLGKDALVGGGVDLVGEGCEQMGAHALAVEAFARVQGNSKKGCRLRMTL